MWTDDDEAAWRAELKVGDEVVINSGYGIRYLRLRTVQRVTPQRVVVDGSQYRKSDGQRMGSGGWESAWLQRPTDEARATIRRERSIDLLRHWQWEKLDNDTLFRIVEMLPAKEKAGA